VGTKEVFVLFPELQEFRFRVGNAGLAFVTRGIASGPPPFENFVTFSAAFPSAVAFSVRKRGIQPLLDSWVTLHFLHPIRFKI
jgi:hypothetical protein